jgi:hypothetical protein
MQRRGGTREKGRAEQMRLLMSVARRHRTYGEAVAEAIGALRPRLQVTVVAPESFEEELTRLGPEVVVSDRPDPAGPDDALAWVEFFADSDHPSKVRVGGRRREIVNPSFIELLAVVDEAWELARAVAVVA